MSFEASTGLLSSATDHGLLTTDQSKKARRSNTSDGLFSGFANRLCYRHPLIQIDVLNSVQQRYPFVHRALECLAAADKAGAAGPLVDDRRLDRLGRIALAR